MKPIKIAVPTEFSVESAVEFRNILCKKLALKINCEYGCHVVIGDSDRRANDGRQKQLYLFSVRVYRQAKPAQLEILFWSNGRAELLDYPLMRYSKIEGLSWAEGVERILNFLGEYIKGTVTTEITVVLRPRQLIL